MKQVRSHFRTPWFGVVLDEHDYSHDKRTGTILVIAVIRDRRGILMRKRKVVVLNRSWTTPASFSLEGVNPDWLKLPPLPRKF